MAGLNITQRGTTVRLKTPRQAVVTTTIGRRGPAGAGLPAGGAAGMVPVKASATDYDFVLRQLQIADVQSLTAALAALESIAHAASTYATRDNAALTGVPTAPTAPVDTNTTQLATTAFVVAQGYVKTSSLGALAPLGVGGGLSSSGGNLTADVRSVAGRTGAVTLAVGDVSGAAALAGANFAGPVTAGSSSVNWQFIMSGTTLGMASGNSLTWYNGSNISGASADLQVWREAADTLAQYRGANPQAFRVYNMRTDPSNYERLSISYSSNRALIKHENAGTGAIRDLLLQGGGIGGLGIGGNGAGSANWWLNASGHFIPTDNSFDIGGSSNRVRSLYLSNRMYTNEWINFASADTGVFWTGRGNTFITSPAAATVQLGNVDAAAPVSQYFKVQNVASGTSNAAGVDRYYDASQGTGLGNSGGHVFRVAPAGTTGSAQNALTEGVRIGGQFPFSILFRGETTGLISTTSGQVRVYANGSPPVGFMATNTEFLNRLSLTGASPAAGLADVYLEREAANTLALRNGANTQTFRWYDTYADPSNYRLGWLGFQSGNLYLGQLGAGTGATISELRFVGSAYRFYAADGVTAFAQLNSSFLRPLTTNSIDLGTTTLSFKDIYSSSVYGFKAVDASNTVRGWFGTPSWDRSWVAMQNGSLSDSPANCAFAQSFAGATVVNAPNGQGVYLRINNADRVRISTASVVDMFASGTADPSTTDIIAGFGTMWKNTTSGEVRYWVNDGGVMKKSAALA